MSKCAAKFALAVSDPFNIAARGVCIPGDGTPSQKTHAFTRLEVTIGLGGVAAIYVTPCLANNLPTLAYTTSIYDGTTSDALEPFTEGGAYGPGGDFILRGDHVWLLGCGGGQHSVHCCRALNHQSDWR